MDVTGVEVTLRRWATKGEREGGELGGAAAILAMNPVIEEASAVESASAVVAAADFGDLHIGER